MEINCKSYRQGHSLSIKAMKCCLSCILNLSENEKDITRVLLESELWNKLVNYYKLVLKAPKLEIFVKEKWDVVTVLTTIKNK